MTGAVFASTYLDPPSGLLAVTQPLVHDNGTGWSTDIHFHRGWAADALRRARRNSAMGMTDPQAVAAIPAYLIRRLTQASLVKDSNGALIAPNILTDFQAMTAPGVALLIVLASAFMAGCTTLPNKASWRRYCLSAGAQYDRRVNREAQASAGVLTGLQTVPQYLKALTDSGQLANFQSLTAG